MKPDMPPTLQTSGVGVNAFSSMFHVFANLTLKDIYFMNATSDGVLIIINDSLPPNVKTVWSITSQ